jgi:hypothetical protein
MPTELEQRARELFEAWLDRQPAEYLTITAEQAGGKSGDDRYLSPSTALAWNAWEAALQAQQPDTVSAAEVFRIAGGDIECSPTPSPKQALECLRDLRECYDESLAQQPGAQAVAYCDPSDPINSTAFAWPGTDRAERHREPLFTHPQPPSIPEPSEADVEAACIAYDAELGINTSPEWLSEIDDKTPIRAALTTYTALLREKIGGTK